MRKNLPWFWWIRSWWPALIILMIVVVELVGHWIIRSRIPKVDDWNAATAWIHQEAGEKDAFLAAPTWADPLMRLHLGDLLSLENAARSDLAPFERLWEISIRGHRSDAVEREPDVVRSFGTVMVRRWELGSSSVLYDFNAHTRDAEVRAGDRSCSWRRMSPQQGGIWQGPLWPSERFFCGPQSWLWVGDTIIEDLDFQPRRCIWQHPRADGPVVSIFRDVPLGQRLVFYGGLYYAHEREQTRPEVTARILVDDIEIGRLVHRDGDGWKRVELDPTPLGESKERGDVTVEVTADNPDMRTLCWAATTRGPAREVGE